MKKYGTDQTWDLSSVELKYSTKINTSSQILFEPSTRPQSLWSGRVEIGMWSPWLNVKTCSVNKGETLIQFLTMSVLSRCLCHPSPWSGLPENWLKARWSQPLSSMVGRILFRSTPGGFKACLIWWLFTKNSVTWWLESLYRWGLDSRVANQICKSLKRLGATLYFAGPDEWRSKEFRFMEVSSLSMKFQWRSRCDVFFACATRTSWLRITFL